MNDLDIFASDSTKTREQIQQLDRLGNDCWQEQQFAKAEKFWQRAAELAESLNDLSLMLKQRYWLASMQRMQGKYKEALSVYTWSIEVAYNPQPGHALTEYDLWYVAGGFMNFVEVGRFLPDMKAADLERVLDRGLDWLASIGKQDWAAGLRLKRGVLWHNQGRNEAAIAEMEAALALKRRYPNAPGYSLGAHLFQVGYVLTDMERLEEAESYHRQVVAGDEFSHYDKHRAWRELAYICLRREDFLGAETCVQQALNLAWTIESLHPISTTYNLLGNILWKQKQIEKAIEAKIQAWHYARQYGEEETLYSIYQDMAELTIDRSQQSTPERYIRKARRWLRWALPLAVRLDRQVQTTWRQDRIQNLQRQCDEILRD
jgi:tetratricopeptide (TPR) repeat protein